jgi:hypothetical protein
MKIKRIKDEERKKRWEANNKKSNKCSINETMLQNAQRNEGTNLNTKIGRN